LLGPAAFKITLKDVFSSATAAAPPPALTTTAAAAGSIPYSDFKNSANSCTSLTVKPTNFSANCFTSALMFTFFPPS
jgi:hypothetical protein